MKKKGVVEFAMSLYDTHPELKRPVGWDQFKAMAKRSGVTVRLTSLSRPARLLRFGDDLCIRISKDLSLHQRTYYGMHELCHVWRDEAGGPCIYADDATVVDHPAENFADFFAWFTTSTARIFLEPRTEDWAEKLKTVVKAGKIVPDFSPITIQPTGRYTTPVVGESYRQAIFERICGPRRPEGYSLEVAAVLTCENHNRFDPKAVRVDVQGWQVGYLSRALARLHRRKFALRTVHCRGKIVGGWDRGGGDTGHFGIALDLPHNEGHSQ